MSSSPSLELERAYLLWRTLTRFKEFQDGQVRLSKENSIRMFKSQNEQFLGGAKTVFSDALKTLLSGSALDKINLDKFVGRAYESYMREIEYVSNRKSQFSIDILFQVIETLTMESGSSKSDPAGDPFGIADPSKSSLTKQDMSQILSYLKAYNKMLQRFQGAGNIKKAIELSDSIITQASIENLDIPILALDNMFNLITAQFVLAQKFLCSQLLVAWKKEYGFDEFQESRVAKFIPANASLLEFRTHYAKALKVLQENPPEDGMGEMDLFLIRTVSNYYSSWINQVANQISKTATAT